MYMLDNGEMFNSKEEAEMREQFLEVVKIIDQYLEDDDSESIVILLLRNRKKFIDFLTTYKEREQ